MKRFLALLLLTALPALAGTVTPTWNFNTAGITNVGNKNITIMPIAKIGIAGTNYIVAEPLRGTLTNGVYSRNLENGFAYRVEVQGFDRWTVTNWYATNVTGSVLATDYTTASTNLGGSLVAYSAASSDARYQPLSTNLNGWSRIPTNQLSSGGGGANYTNTGTLYAGQISGSAIGTNTSHLVGTNQFETTIGTRQAATNSALQSGIDGKLAATNGTAYGLTVVDSGTTVFQTDSGFIRLRQSGTSDQVLNAGPNSTQLKMNGYNVLSADTASTLLYGGDSTRRVVSIDGGGLNIISSNGAFTKLITLGGDGNLTTTGTNSAGYFVGDGSGLTNLAVSGSGITNGQNSVTLGSTTFTNSISVTNATTTYSATAATNAGIRWLTFNPIKPDNRNGSYYFSQSTTDWDAGAPADEVFQQGFNFTPGGGSQNTNCAAIWQQTELNWTTGGRSVSEWHLNFRDRIGTGSARPLQFVLNHSNTTDWVMNSAIGNFSLYKPTNSFGSWAYFANGQSIWQYDNGSVVTNGVQLNLTANNQVQFSAYGSTNLDLYLGNWKTFTIGAPLSSFQALAGTTLGLSSTLTGVAANFSGAVSVSSLTASATSSSVSTLPMFVTTDAATDAATRNWAFGHLYYGGFGGGGGVGAKGHFTFAVSNAKGGTGYGSSSTPVLDLYSNRVEVVGNLFVGGNVTATNGFIAPALAVAPNLTLVNGATIWSDGTNLCVIIKNAGGTTTNKFTMTTWP